MGNTVTNSISDFSFSFKGSNVEDEEVIKGFITAVGFDRVFELVS